jgi:hypothetical protein
LNGATKSPRLARAAISPRVTVVLPAPLWVPAMTMPLITASLSLRA